MRRAGAMVTVRTIWMTRLAAGRRLCWCLCVLVAGCAPSSSGAAPTPTGPQRTATPSVPELSSALVTYTGHSGPVIGVAWAPDGKTLASCGNDGTVQLWDAATGTSQWKTSVAQYAFALAWSPDGGRIAAGGSDGTVSLLDSASGRVASKLTGQSGAIEGVAWSPDGKRVVAGSQGGAAVVYDAASGHTLVTYKEHTDSVERVAWSPDGTRIATASYDGTVRV